MRNQLSRHFLNLYLLTIHNINGYIDAGINPHIHKERTMNEGKKETRNGYIIVGTVERPKAGSGGYPTVSLALGSTDNELVEDPFWVYSFTDSDESMYDGNQELVDKAFQIFITRGIWKDMPLDPTFKDILAVARIERLTNVFWYRRKHRFLPTTNLTKDNLRFIFTDDKSDLGERQRRIVEIGEEAYAQEEAAREARERAEAAAKRQKNDALRTEHAELIKSTALSAIKDHSVPEGTGKKLAELGLLGPSTNFRNGSQFPGEARIILYEFADGELKYTGYLGFDEHYNLLSVDERLPEMKEFYLGEPKAA
jgi:hypothetical protein